MTPEEIAKEMGGFEHTKDGGRKAVIGKANRMDLPAKRAKCEDPVERERRAAVKRTNDAVRQQCIRDARAKVKAPAQGPEPRPPVDPFVGSLEIPTRELRPRLSTGVNQCRFIAADVPSPEYLACGNVTLPGKSYCSHHHGIVYKRPVAKPISDAERDRREARGRALAFAALRSGRGFGSRNPTSMFPVVDSPSLQTMETGA